VDNGGVQALGAAGGFASANLATGQLKAVARAIGQGGTSTNEALANTQMVDSLTFHLPGGLSLATVGFDLHVDGTITAPPPNAIIHSAGFTFAFGTPVNVNTSTATGINVSTFAAGGCCVLGTPAFPLPEDIRGSINVTNGEAVGFSAFVSADITA